MLTNLSDGAPADLCGHRLKLWISRQVQFIIPQKLSKKIMQEFKKNHDESNSSALNTGTAMET